MAKEILVGNTLTTDMIDAGRVTIEKIAKSNLQVVAAFWLYFEEAEEWRLALVSTRLNRDGPLALYGELSYLMFNKVEIFGISLINTTFLDASDRLVCALVSIPGGTELRDIRLTGFVSHGIYVPDTYVYFVSEAIKPFK